MIDMLLDLPEEVIPEVVDGVHLFWTTPFTEYTVTEGLLLLFLVFGFIWLIVWFFRGV